MQFTIECPNDGSVDVTLDDVAAVSMREADQIEVVFECPLCGDEIMMVARVPSLLVAALEALEADGDEEDRRLAGFLVIAQVDEDAIEISLPSHDLPDDEDPRIDAYCEYFRRELAAVECVEDALAEIDQRQRP